MVITIQIYIYSINSFPYENVFRTIWGHTLHMNTKIGLEQIEKLV